MIKSNRGEIECPVAGCNKLIRISDLKPDKALAKKVERHKRRLEEEAEKEDDDAVLVRSTRR
jgi:hypothetical protein